jgi:hypothetical protein
VPIYPELTEAQQDYVFNCVREFFADGAGEAARTEVANLSTSMD